MRPLFQKNKSARCISLIALGLCLGGWVGGLTAAGTLTESIQENVRLQMQTVMNDSQLLRELVETQKLWIVGGVYNLQTGKANLLYAGAAAAGNHTEPGKNSKE